MFKRAAAFHGGGLQSAAMFNLPLPRRVRNNLVCFLEIWLRPDSRLWHCGGMKLENSVPSCRLVHRSGEIEWSGGFNIVV
jgi:hypothetical protein